MCTSSTNRVSIWVILFIQLLSAHCVSQTVSGDLDAAAYASLQAMLDGTSLDINDASEDALSSFPMIGPTGALRVLAYRSTRRPISNIEMLVDILGWSTEDADLLRPYLRFRTPRQTSTLRTRVQARVTTNGAGAENIRLLTRTRLRSSILEMALVTEFRCLSAVEPEQI